MATVTFTANLQRHVACPSVEAVGQTVREILESVFRDNEQVRSYVLDDQGALRKHMNIFVDGEPIRDRTSLGDIVGANAEVFIMQALSGG